MSRGIFYYTFLLVLLTAFKTNAQLEGICQYSWDYTAQRFFLFKDGRFSFSTSTCSISAYGYGWYRIMGNYLLLHFAKNEDHKEDGRWSAVETASDSDSVQFDIQVVNATGEPAPYVVVYAGDKHKHLLLADEKGRAVITLQKSDVETELILSEAPPASLDCPVLLKADKNYTIHVTLPPRPQNNSVYAGEVFRFEIGRRTPYGMLLRSLERKVFYRYYHLTGPLEEIAEKNKW